MADDLREREPIRDQADNPPEDGLRSDVGASSSGSGPVAAGGTNVDRAERVTEPSSGGAAPSGGGAAPPDPLADVKHPTADE